MRGMGQVVTLATIGVLLVAAGLVLAWWSAGTTDEPAPLPSVTFSVAEPTPRPVDPDAIGPNAMDASRLLIPAIGVYAPIVETDIDDGLLAIPEAGSVGRYIGGGGVASTTGTVLLAGHVSSYGEPGALQQLATLQAGDWIHVTDHEGNRLDAVVTGMDVQLKSELPSGLFTPDGDHKIVLVTCGGRVETRPDGSRHYESNVIVTAAPADLGRRLIEAPNAGPASTAGVPLPGTR